MLAQCRCGRSIRWESFSLSFFQKQSKSTLEVTMQFLIDKEGEILYIYVISCNEHWLQKNGWAWATSYNHWDSIVDQSLVNKWCKHLRQWGLLHRDIAMCSLTMYLYVTSELLISFFTDVNLVMPNLMQFYIYNYFMHNRNHLF